MDCDAHEIRPNARADWCRRYTFHIDRGGRFCRRCREDAAFRGMLAERATLHRAAVCGAVSGTMRCPVFGILTDAHQCERCQHDPLFRTFLYGQGRAGDSVHGQVVDAGAEGTQGGSQGATHPVEVDAQVPRAVSGIQPHPGMAPPHRNPVLSALAPGGADRSRVPPSTDDLAHDGQRDNPRPREGMAAKANGGRGGAAHRPGESPDGTPAEGGVCVHRGGTIRMEARRCCGTKTRRIEIFSCAMRREAHDGICLVCPWREAPA